jgi:hypothetical protein
MRDLSASPPHCQQFARKEHHTSMKKLLVVFLMAASLHGAELTGQVYRDSPETYRLVYVKGYIDGYLHGRNQGGEDSLVWLLRTVDGETRKVIDTAVKHAKASKTDFGAICMIMDQEGVTIPQMMAILDKYLADHPESWDKPIRELAEHAFIEACEKRAKNQ